MANTFPPDYNAYQAAAHDCGFLGLGCAIEDTVKWFQGGPHPTVIPFDPRGDLMGASQKGAITSGKAIGKASEQVGAAAGGAADVVVKSVGGEANAIQQGFGDALKSTQDFLTHNLGKYLPYIAIGGGALLIILIATKR